MKRDMDFVRCTLIQVEEADEPVSLADLMCGKWSFAEVVYHAEMLQAHGLLDAAFHRDAHGSVILGEIHGLTWDGCDYLDSIRDEGVWARTKRVIKETVGPTSLEIIRQTAVLVAMQAIKTHLGVV